MSWMQLVHILVNLSSVEEGISVVAQNNSVTKLTLPSSSIFKFCGRQITFSKVPDFMRIHIPPLSSCQYSKIFFAIPHCFHFYWVKLVTNSVHESYPSHEYLKARHTIVIELKVTLSLTNPS
jgi:hypothetical protein